MNTSVSASVLAGTATMTSALSLRVDTLTSRESRHRPRLCPMCASPLARQEGGCWRCGAPVRPDRFCDARLAEAAHRIRPHRRAALSASVRPDRGTGVRDGRSRNGARLTASSRAQVHARWQRERAEADQRAKKLARELAAAIDGADAGYRRLGRRLDDFDARLAAVRRTLLQAP